MTHALLFLLCVLGFASLAAAMERHQRDVIGRTLDTRTVRWARTIGWLLLTSALVLAVTGQGWGRGLVSYSGHTSVGAGLVFLGLTAHGWLRIETETTAPPRSAR